MDDFRWAQKELKRYTYRPGWKLQLINSFEFGFDSWTAILRVDYKVLDTYNPTTMIPVTVNCRMPINFQKDSDLFARQLQCALLDIEKHESQEWLRRDGKIYDDPHKNDHVRI